MLTRCLFLSLWKLGKCIIVGGKLVHRILDGRQIFRPIHCCKMVAAFGKKFASVWNSSCKLLLKKLLKVTDWSKAFNYLHKRETPVPGFVGSGTNSHRTNPQGITSTWTTSEGQAPVCICWWCLPCKFSVFVNKGTLGQIWYLMCRCYHIECKNPIVCYWGQSSFGINNARIVKTLQRWYFR